jgi:two-component system, chemotaxis family, CheB/CheR fusion protein
MGASAGGLEAFQRFFAHVPPANGMAFVLVQHLDPRHATLLPELLAKSTPMSVETVKDETPVQPDHLYVIPANGTLTIEGGLLRVTPAETKIPRMPIDRLFHSLAEDQGHNAVCILFSGSGTDGTLGLRAVKEHGGMVMAQSPESAQHDPMPRSAIATGLVDHVLPPEDLAAKLMEYATYLRTLPTPQGPAEPFSPEELDEIYNLVRHSTGHDFSRYKTSTLNRRIQRRMQVLQLSSVPDYLQRLRMDAGEVDRLFRDLLISVTHFFRDPESWQVLAGEVVPQIVEQATAEGALRIWVPGCATGEEAYSIAILLKEEMVRKAAKLKVQIFAADIDEEALVRARQASYPEGIAEHVTPERLERFFVKQIHGYQVAKEIREMVIFSTHDLIKDPPFSRLDLIICRNLLIYLEVDLQRFVTNVFHYALRRGGYLFLGPSESVTGPPESFRTLDRKHRVFQRGDVLARRMDVLPLAAGGPRLAVARHTSGRATGPVHADLLLSIERVLLDQFTSPWVVINADSEALYYSPRTGKYLEPAAGMPTSSIVEMARTGLRLDLRAAIHKALKTGQAVSHDNVVVEANGEVQRIDLSVRPLWELGDATRLFLVVFNELGGPRSREAAAAEGAVPQTGDAIVHQLESELRATKEHLQATAEELETSNEELKSSNEELLSTNEELQSTNEELQTSKEELQSVNEELETINAELVKKVQELDAANSDLENLFHGTQIPSLFVDSNLRIKSFTEASKEVFRLIETDVDRPIADIAPRFAGDLLSDMKGVLRTLAAKEREIHVPEDGSSYLMRIIPYRRLDNVIDGLVLTFQNVTQLTQARDQRARLAAIVESAHDAIVSCTLDGIITSWNAAASQLFGYAEQEAIGSALSLILPGDRQNEVKEIDGRLLRGERVLPYESIRQTKDGQRVAVLVGVSPVRDTTGQIVGTASIFRDITEAKHAERLRGESQRKDQFLAVLSHELRGPLASLRMSVNLLESKVTGGGRIREAVEIADRQLEHLASLVDQLLDASRVASGRFVLDRKVRDLVEIVRTSAEDQRGVIESGGVQLSVRLPADPLWVNVDALRMSQVVSNLLGNALKFSSEGGHAELSLERDDAQNAAVLRVRDEGAGIAPDVLPLVFQPFTRVDAGETRDLYGLGLGLSLVQALVQTHGGSVEAKSEGRGHGTEITVRLPLVHPPADVAAAASREAARPVKVRRRIMVVEDHRDTAKSMRWSLEARGHEVVVVSDGQSALATVPTFQPEVVLCDIGLPGAMDGYGIAEAIRHDHTAGNPYLIAVTGYGMPADKARAVEAGFDHFVVKGGPPRALLDLVDGLAPRPSSSPR